MILGLIPARGGSKSIPRKNIRPLGGKPLIQWTVESARSAKSLDRLILSTEDHEIAEVGEHLGVEVLSRPHEFARDDTPMAFVIRHALESLNWEPKVLVLLQPTSPFRRSTLIDEAVETLTSRKVWSVASFAPIPPNLSPDYAWGIFNGSAKPLQPKQPTRRQDARQYFYRDGSVYAFDVQALKRGDNVYKHCVPLYVGRDEVCTLDEPEDWQEAERRLAEMAVA